LITGCLYPAFSPDISFIPVIPWRFKSRRGATLLSHRAVITGRKWNGDEPDFRGKSRIKKYCNLFSFDIL